MSDDEKFVAIGRMATEKTETKQKVAVLRQQIKDFGSKFSRLSAELIREQPPPNIGVLLEEIQKIIALGGFEKLHTAVTDCNNLERRVAELSLSLRNAGAE